jgi:hypothetical protein
MAEWLIFQNEEASYDRKGENKNAWSKNGGGKKTAPGS